MTVFFHFFHHHSGLFNCEQRLSCIAHAESNLVGRTQGGQQTSHVQQEQEEQEEEEEEEEDEEEGDSTQPIAQPTQSAIQPVTELQQTTPTTSESLRSDVRVVNAVRLVTHALPQNTEWNHWSIYLVLTGGGSVRFHMTTVANSNKGAFSVSPALSYTLTNSAIRHWDFSVVANLTVGHVFTLIIDEGLQKYEMTGDGSGCRFWV
jgi:hypothetical protein